MSRRRLLSIGVVAVVAMTTGFLVAGQVKAQLLTPSNQVARYQALVRSVQDLEKTNEDLRAKIAALRAKIGLSRRRRRSVPTALRPSRTRSRTCAPTPV
jgi:uncharacterized protein YlxW (UPF0749 family)